MKKLWKGLCTAVALMTVWLCCTTVCFAGAELNNGTFKYEADFYNNTCVLTEYLGSDTVVNVPESIDGYRVVSLGRECFLGKTNVVKVNIPSTVKSIGAIAFKYSGIREITIPETVTQLSGSAFYKSENLERVVIKAPITKIEMNTFNGCYNLKSVVLPNTIREIDSYAFQYCRSLTSINIPSSLKEINRAVFEGCSSLVSIDLKNCESISSYTFSGCTNLQNVKMEKCRGIGNIFRYCTSLKEIRIPESVQFISGDAFRGCSSLEKVYVCNSNTEIAINAFDVTPKLTVYGYSGSTAQDFARRQGARFQDIRTAEPSITSITLNAKSGNMKVGNVFTLKATVKPNNAIIKKVTWTRDIRTAEPSITSITLNAKSGNMKVGNVFTLKATVKPNNAIIKKVTWTSSNSKVASVSSSGKITAKHPGTAVITGMTINGKSAKCIINVRPQGTPITKLQSQKKRWLNIQYRANRNADGYQIQYGTSSNMKGAKYAAVNNSAIRSYTRKDVKSGATYYVRVRTFNIVNGKRIYSDWSGIKRMRVK